jgi:uncharacterized protein YcbX
LEDNIVGRIVEVEVIGVDPPCKRCATTQKNAEQAISKLKKDGIEASLKKLDISSREAISRYGVILSPAVAINGQIKVAGRIPSSDEIIKIIKSTT